MPGKGQGKNTSVKGTEASTGAPKQHRHKIVKTSSIEGIKKNSIKKVARRGGVKRISSGIAREIRDSLSDYLGEVMSSTVALVQHSNKRTVKVKDVVMALGTKGRPILL